jgi:hypothetical protein
METTVASLVNMFASAGDDDLSDADDEETFGSD